MFADKLIVVVFLNAVRSTSFIIRSSALAIHTSIGAIPDPVAAVIVAVAPTLPAMTSALGTVAAVTPGYGTYLWGTDEWGK